MHYFREPGQKSIGEFVEALIWLKMRGHSELPIVFDFDEVPKEFCSWRGEYGQLTLDWTDWGNPEKEKPTVQSLLDEAEKAQNGTFEGYKGGECKMNPCTPLWADRRDHPEHRMVTGVEVNEEEGRAIIQTKIVEEDDECLYGDWDADEME